MSRASVIVVGSINVDLIVSVPRLPTAGETVLGSDLVQQGGGKSANQAVAASRAGAATALVGAVGADELGRAALDGLAGADVDTAACHVLEGAHTGVALIVVDAAGENQIAVAPGANDALDGPMVTAGLAGIEPHEGAVCLLGLEVGDAALEAGASWAAEHGLTIVLNPAPARDIPPAVLALRPILTPNRSELALISGEADAVPERGARSLAGSTGAAVVVTLGREGALLFAGGKATRVPAPAVSAVDSTGAGDALNGILSAELARGASLPEALRWAVAGASISTETPGAQAGAPTRATIEARLG